MEQQKEEYFTSPSTGMTYRIDPELGKNRKEPMFPEKIAKAKEILSKIDPEQFKAITGRDLHKK